MNRIYSVSGQLQKFIKCRISSLFLIMNILFWSLLALVVSGGIIYGIYHTLRGFEVTIFCVVGYTGFIVGFLGGYLFLDKQG